MTLRARRRGFTLVEILIALAIGAMMLAGAIELHVAFNRQAVRQQQIAEMQQNLRVARQLLERAIRGAGLGLQGGAIQTPGCLTYFPIQFHGNNAFPAGPVWSVGNAANLDTDPDWIQIVGTADTGTSSLACPAGSCGGSQSAAGALPTVQCKQNFAVGDWVVAVDTTPVPGIPPTKINCIYPVTAATPGAACGAACNCGTLTLGAACGLCPTAIPYPAPVRLLSSGSATAPIPALTILRVEPTVTPACTNPPCLMASYTSLNPLAANPPPTLNTSASWQLVVENIEDMQFVFIMNDGRSCGALGYAVDDPITCDPRAVKAVRFSITVRSPTANNGSAQGVLGWNFGLAVPPGGLEDEAASVTYDSILRRTVTAEVQLRNNP